VQFSRGFYHAALVDHGLEDFEIGEVHGTRLPLSSPFENNLFLFIQYSRI
jgi:hypothetical protein